MLTVITHTQNRRPELLKRCIASVEAALPSGAEHRIIRTRDHDDWVQRRVHDAREHKFVAFVDDDDYITPNSLSLCLSAIQESGLGSAVTNEIEVRDGQELRSSGRRTYMDAAMHPRVVHHLCLLRGDLIDTKAIEFQKRFGVGIDWFIRQSVVQPHGCIVVPIFGYYWTQHSDQHTESTQDLYAKSIRGMQAVIRETWPAKFNGPLQVFDVTSQKTVTI